MNLANVLLGLSMCVPAFLARWTPTKESREVAQCAREEIDARHNRKEASDLLGLPLSDLSEQLNGEQPLNIGRLAELRTKAPAVWHAFLRRLARLDGGEYIDPNTATLLKGAATLTQQRPVLSMLLPANDEQEVA